MTHKIIVNCETGEVTQVEYTPEEQAAHDAAVAAQALTEADQQAEIQASTKTLADQILESPTELAKLKAALGL